MSCINVVFAGTGSALHPYRGQSSVVIDVAGVIVAVDLGCSALNVLARTGIDPVEINYVIVTHEHYDHICGVPHLFFLKTFGGTPRLVMAGTPEALDSISRIVSNIKGERSVSISFRAVDELSRIGVKATLFEALHTVPALSLSLEYSGVKVVVSGDTRPTSQFKAAASGAALAVHEATMPPGEYARAELKGHSTVDQAMEQVSVAGLGALYHLTQASEEAALKEGARRGVLVPLDGTVVKVC